MSVVNPNKSSIVGTEVEFLKTTHVMANQSMSAKRKLIRAVGTCDGDYDFTILHASTHGNHSLSPPEQDGEMAEAQQG